MKTKLFNLLAAALLVIGVLMPAFAVMAKEKEGNETKTVTVHKILMEKENFYKDIFPGRKGIDGQVYNAEKIKDLTNFFGKNSKEIKGVYFAWQKRDEYSGEWRYINHLGHYVEPIKNANGNEKKKLELIEAQTKHGEFTTENGAKFYTGHLKPGKYRIVEVKEKSTYIGKTINDRDTILADSKAVPVEITLPIVNEGGVVTDAHVYPKNTEDKPLIDKNFSKDNKLKAIKNLVTSNIGADYENFSVEKARVTASIGDKIPYEVKTKVNAGTEYGKLVWKDSMTNGLTFLKGSLTIQMNNKVLTPFEGTNKKPDYKIEQDDRGFTLYLTQQGLEKVTKITKPKNEDGQSLNKGEDVEFTLTYSATVNGNAIVDVPEKNDIRLEYGNKPHVEQSTIAVTPKKQELNVEKKWASVGEAPNDIVVTYILRNNDNFYSVTLNKNTIQKTYDLGKGVKFEAKDNFGGTFTGLKADGQWELSERVAGYNADINDPENSDAINGQAIITNTKDNSNPTPLHPTSPEVVVGGRRFVKTDYKDVKEAKRLTGAVFYVKKDEKYLVAKDDFEQSLAKSLLEKAKKDLDTKVKNYNELSPEKQKGTDGRKKQIEVNKAQDEYNAAFRQASLKYKWVEEKESATEFISDGDGRFEVSGLAYGSYELEEKTAPVGYGKLSNNVKFEINEGSYKGKSEEMKYELVAEKVPDAHAIQVKNRKITIPQTGGIGTVIFTVAGLAIMAGAGYVMIRRRNHDQA
ncbi:pilin N-terminal domain-containing protein [Streptococcus phocae subsp. phocae]